MAENCSWFRKIYFSGGGGGGGELFPLINSVLLMVILFRSSQLLLRPYDFTLTSLLILDQSLIHLISNDSQYDLPALESIFALFN